MSFCVTMYDRLCHLTSSLAAPCLPDGPIGGRQHMALETGTPAAFLPRGLAQLLTRSLHLCESAFRRRQVMGPGVLCSLPAALLLVRV